jgi:hypothetical protein
MDRGRHYKRILPSQKNITIALKRPWHCRQSADNHKLKTLANMVRQGSWGVTNWETVVPPYWFLFP